jgi:hypothetical protein
MLYVINNIKIKRNIQWLEEEQVLQTFTQRPQHRLRNRLLRQEV